jgi:hypothetical protein
MVWWAVSFALRSMSAQAARKSLGSTSGRRGAIVWSTTTCDDILIHKRKRLVFQYGESEESVENKIYERDIVLKWEKNLVKDESYES